MEELPSYELAARAADERRHLHRSVTELRSCLNNALDVRKNAREHLGKVCGVTAVVGLALGYLVAGSFVHH